MSNMEDIPLGEQQERVAQNSNESLKSKSNSLRRFFKMGKKLDTQSESSLQPGGQDANSPTGSGSNSTGIEKVDDSQRRNTLRKRFHLKIGSSKSTNAVDAEAEKTASLEPKVGEAGNAPDAPPKPNTKPTLKSSISNYWHNIFKRHQATKKTPEGSDSVSADQPENVDTLDADEAAAADAIADAVSGEGGGIGGGISPPKSFEKGGIPAIIEEVQMLAISEEVEEDQSQQNAQKSQPGYTSRN